MMSGSISSTLAAATSLVLLVVLGILVLVALGAFVVSLARLALRIRTLQIRQFDDTAMKVKLGPGFTDLVRARVGGGREGGRHLYLVTGEQEIVDMAAVEKVPQAAPLAVLLSLLRPILRKTQFIIDGALIPVDSQGEAIAVMLSLSQGSKLLNRTEFWPTQPPGPNLTATASNRSLALAAAAWIDYVAADHSPKQPPARDVFAAADARSWALFRAGAELNRMSYTDEAADLYERALSSSGENLGALVDLANLRRRDGYFSGAERLSARAVELKEERNRRYEVESKGDADWYRAKLVLGTSLASWARALEATPGAAYSARLRNLRSASRLRNQAGESMFELARTAARTHRAIEDGLNGREQLQEQARISPSPVTDLYDLIETTFLPGALLLAAGNRTYPGLPPVPEAPVALASAGTASSDEPNLWAEIDAALAGWGQPDKLVELATRLKNKSGRVQYNLACYYSRAAQDWTEASYGRRHEWLRTSTLPAGVLAPTDPAYTSRLLAEARDYLEEGIRRTPPLERRALLAYARRDSDLAALRHAHPTTLPALAKMIPDR
jgi:hypothetical protein